jgi:pyroglutamyl-peptidase
VLRVIVSGFGPFPGAPFNPSAILAKALARKRRPAFAEIALTTHVFPTVYATVDRDLTKIFACKPDIVLMFGLAGRRDHLCIETRARNALSVLVADASGYRPPRGVIAPGERPAMEGVAPFATLLSAVRPTCFPARLSHDAGRYVCNYAYWCALKQWEGGAGPLVQFVHIPWLGPGRRRRRRGEQPPPSFHQLVAAGEALLIALIAARRRQSHR